MEPAWSPHGATSRTGTLRSAAPACPPCGTPHTIAVSCHRRHGQLVYTGKSFFLPFLFPPQHLCRHRSHRGKWLNSHCYLFKIFFNKYLWYPGKRKQQPLDKRGAGRRGKEFVQCFLLMWDAAVLLCSQRCCWMQSSSSTPTWVCTSCYITLVFGGLIVLSFSRTMWIYRNQLRFLKWSPKVVGMQSLDVELPCLDCIVPEIIGSSRLKLCLPFIYNRGKSIYN